MKISYDKSVDALYIAFRSIEPATADCKSLSENIIADYAKDGNLVGIEILEASEILGKEALSQMSFEVLS